MKNPVKVVYFKGPNGTIRFGNVFVKAGEYTVNTFVYHEGTHWDEVVSDLVLGECAAQFFTGADTAKRRFASREEKMDDAFVALKNGELWVGCGDSPFNEHETQSRGEVTGHAAATLIAHLIGAYERPELRYLLADALASDRKPTQDAGHIHNVIKAMKSTGKTDKEIFEWAMEAAKAIYLQQLDYWQGARESFDTVGRIEQMPTASGQTVPVAIIVADEDSFGKVALCDEPKGKGAGVMVAMNKAGQLTVLTNKRHELPFWFLQELFRRLAIKHCEKIGQVVPRECTAYQYQNMPDDIGGLHLWREGEGILNKGTPIGLSLERVAEIVREVVKILRCNGRPETVRRPRQNNHRPPAAPKSNNSPAPEVTPAADAKASALGMADLEKVLDEKPA